MKLRFPEPLESEFQRDHARKSLLTVRAALILGALLYAAFGFVDAWALPETRESAFRIRFFFAIPILLLTFAWTFSPSLQKRMQPMLTVVFIIAASAVTWLVALSRQSEAGYFAYAGRIRIESETGRGTAVTIELPREGRNERRSRILKVGCSMRPIRSMKPMKRRAFLERVLGASAVALTGLPRRALAAEL